MVEFEGSILPAACAKLLLLYFFPCYYISVLRRKALRGWAQNLLKIFQWQMEEWEEWDSGKSVPWSGAIRSWKQWWAPAGIAQPPSSTFHLCWAAHVREQCFHFPLLWAQGVTQSPFPPRWLMLLSPKPACSVVLWLEQQGYHSAQQRGWQSWAQQVFIGKDLLPFWITGPWAPWVVWPLHLLFCLAFVSTVSFWYIQKSLPASQFSSTATELLLIKGSNYFVAACTAMRLF